MQLHELIPEPSAGIAHYGPHIETGKRAAFGFAWFCWLPEIKPKRWRLEQGSITGVAIYWLCFWIDVSWIVTKGGEK